ncbi:MAG: WbqC family protein [Patescibacteria group bacterium]
MKVSIFQPTYLSWIGFYKAIEWADTFVFLDDVQFENHSWQIRNRIKMAEGELMLSVPIVRNFPQDINQVKINYTTNWVKKHLKSIELNYSKAPCSREFFLLLKSIYQAQPEKLVALNVNLIKGICSFLGIKTDFRCSSKLGVGNLDKNEKLVAILKKLSADHFLYAEGAWGYMEKEINLYYDNNIQLTPLTFVHPVYTQLNGTFIPYLSIIDMIFNCGKDKTVAILKNIQL